MPDTSAKGYGRNIVHSLNTHESCRKMAANEIRLIKAKRSAADFPMKASLSSILCTMFHRLDLYRVDSVLWWQLVERIHSCSPEKYRFYTYTIKQSKCQKMRQTIILLAASLSNTRNPFLLAVPVPWAFGQQNPSGLQLPSSRAIIFPTIPTAAHSGRCERGT